VVLEFVALVMMWLGAVNYINFVTWRNVF